MMVEFYFFPRSQAFRYDDSYDGGSSQNKILDFVSRIELTTSSAINN